MIMELKHDDEHRPKEGHEPPSTIHKHERQGAKMRRDWIAISLQTIPLLVGGLIFAIAQEHRVTIIEEQIKAQRQLIDQMSRQQYEIQTTINQRLDQGESTLDRLLTLEEFFHGMSPDELAAYERRRKKRD